MKTMALNRQLLRQLSRLGVKREEPPTLEQWHAVIRSISKTYDENDEGRYLQERALSISSHEMRDAFHREKEMSMQLAQASRLSSIGTLASGVAHELNNPLGGIRGYAEMLGESKNLGDSDRAKVKRILALVERMAITIKHLLKLARKPESETMVSVSLNEVVDDCLELFEAQMKYDNIKIDVQFPDENIDVLAESHRLTSIVQNLINNARDEFVRADPSRFPDPRIGIVINQAKSTKRFVCLEVHDNAGGIPKSIIDKIFDPFFTTKDVGKGTGLGLALSRRMVEELGGQISVVSGDGKTTFTVILKRFIEHPEVTSSIQTGSIQISLTPLPGKRKKLLLIESDRSVCESLTSDLQQTFEIVPTKSFSETIGQLDRVKFDYLILGSGLDEALCEKVVDHAVGLNPELGILVVTATEGENLNGFFHRKKIKFVHAITPVPTGEAMEKLIFSTKKDLKSAS